MTRSSLGRTLRRAYWILGLVLLISVIAKLADHVPGLAGTPTERLLRDIYEYLKDMSLVLVTVVAAYLANIFQKRSQFLNSLKEEWRDIVKAKSALFTYTQFEAANRDEYFIAYCRISETIDNMRAVYCNVGETAHQIGIYPYEPLHDMRRALQSLKPDRGLPITADDRQLARDAIMQSFYALRETFLEELDLEAPDHPLLIQNSRRLKKTGAPGWARRRQSNQHKYYMKVSPTDPVITTFLRILFEKEQTTAKPWRKVAAKPGGATASQSSTTAAAQPSTATDATSVT
jgi:hypothetical protein